MSRFYFQSPSDFDPSAWEGEVNNEPSLTVPDESLTVRQIIDRYTRGVPLGVSVRQPVYDDNGSDVHFPDPKTLDLAERAELESTYRSELDRISKANKAYTDSQKSVKAKKSKVDDAPPPSTEEIPFEES